MKDNFSSRYERTKKSKKQNIILNVLIGVVFVGILAVGASILLGDDEPASKQQASEENSTSMSDKDKSNSDEDSNTESTPSDEDENTATADENKNEDQENVDMPEEDKEDTESDGEYKSYTDETAGPDGSWEPVGTKQEEHQNSFEKGTLDWEEKQKALQYATGLSPEEITYWWIGNGGSPNTVKGVVSKAENKDNPYVVMLEWIDGEGWKPTSVERVPGAANQ